MNGEQFQTSGEITSSSVDGRGNSNETISSIGSTQSGDQVCDRGNATEMGNESQGESRRQEKNKEKVEVLTEEEKIKAIEEAQQHLTSLDIPSFNALEIKSKYPKTYKVLWDYIEKKGNYPTGMMDEETMVGLLLYTSRMVTFDFFDSKGIYVSISGDKHGWDYTITYEDELYANEGKSNRTFTEIEAFLKAFEILENQLK